jgi:hypothetical protein
VSAATLCVCCHFACPQVADEEALEEERAYADARACDYIVCCLVFAATSRVVFYQVADEEALEEERAYAEWEATAKPLRGASASPKAKARVKRQEETAAKAKADAAEEAAAAEAAAAAGIGEGDDEDLPLGYYQPQEEPMQVKMEWVLINKGGC